MESEPVATPVKTTPDEDLRLCVDPPNTGHHAASGRPIYNVSQMPPAFRES
jgi:hypothetical protein